MLSWPVICFSTFSASGSTKLICPSYSCARYLSYSVGLDAASACSLSALACSRSASLVISSMIFCASNATVSSRTISSLAVCSSSSFKAFILGSFAVSSRSGAMIVSVIDGSGFRSPGFPKGIGSFFAGTSGSSKTSPASYASSEKSEVSSKSSMSTDMSSGSCTPRGTSSPSSRTSFMLSASAICRFMVLYCPTSTVLTSGNSVVGAASTSSSSP